MSGHRVPRSGAGLKPTAPAADVIRVLRPVFAASAAAVAVGAVAVVGLSHASVAGERRDAALAQRVALAVAPPDGSTLAAGAACTGAGFVRCYRVPQQVGDVVGPLQDSLRRAAGRTATRLCQPPATGAGEAAACQLRVDLHRHGVVVSIQPERRKVSGQPDVLDSLVVVSTV